MEIRKEIESLALWYIPAFIVVTVVSTLYSGYLNSLLGTEQPPPSTIFALISTLDVLLNFVDNLVVGIWLYIRGKKDSGRASLWLLFGVAAHFFAALMYIGLKIYEQQKSNIKLTTPAPEEG